MGKAITTELKEQFHRQWGTLHDVIDGLPEEQWKVGDIESLVPARLVYHILAGTELYDRSTTYEEYRSRQRFTLDWQAAPAAELPGRAAILELLEHLREGTDEWLESLGDDGLAADDEGFPWTGKKKIGRAMYLLRHTQNHIGELNSEMKRRNLPRGKWR